MRKLLIAAALLVSVAALSQGVGINPNNANPHPSAMLDVSSTNKGVLIPRMTCIQRTGISNPATGLLVFDTDAQSLYMFATPGGWKQIKSITSLGELIQGNQAGDMLHWDGTHWVVVSFASQFRYYYRDKDGDQFGDFEKPVLGLVSAAPQGYIQTSGDCDDNNAGINPGATEIPDNSVDENCDGVAACSPAGTACDAGDPCTMNDVTDGNCGCAGVPVNCDDGDPNTIDYCNNGGCQHDTR
ncbi:MAG TPA: putative metal-binding motif-containing protein, partial [Chitinophagaceae bacterium]